MNIFLDNRIRVYIYTAVNGFAWQGCDDTLAASLEECLGRGADPVGGIVPLGGIRRGVVGGRNGTAIFRCHVRKHGDFAGRDCKYVALAFIPFELLDEKRFLNYAAVWNHELLANCLPTSEPLDNCSIDLNTLLLSDKVPSLDEPFWTIAKSDEMTGAAEEVLGKLGAMFQSRKTELGPFSARINTSGDAGDLLAVSWKYSPFSSVSEEAKAADKVRGIRASVSATAEEKAAAIGNWSSAIRQLEELSSTTEGPFRDFIGLRLYVESERADLKEGDPTRKAVENTVEGAVKFVQRIVKVLMGNLWGTSEERSVFEEIQQFIKSQRNIVHTYSPPDDGILNTIEQTARDLEKGIDVSNKVEKWRMTESPSCNVVPQGTSKVLTNLVETINSLKDKEQIDKEDKPVTKEHEEAVSQTGLLFGEQFQPDLGSNSAITSSETASADTWLSPSRKQTPLVSGCTPGQIADEANSPDAGVSTQKKPQWKKKMRWLRWCIGAALALLILFVVLIAIQWIMDSRGKTTSVGSPPSALPRETGQP